VGAAVSVKIFISCVSDEFRAYRDQLRTDLTRLNVEVKVQEDFKDLGGTTVENDDAYIRACDAVIHLVGDMTGWMAQPASNHAILARYPDITERFPLLRDLLERGEDISYTQWEAWLALYQGKPLLIAEAAVAAPRGPVFAPTDATREAQRAHLDRLRAVDHHSGCTFVSADQLAAYVLGSPVLDLLAKEQGGVASRGAASIPYVGVIGMLVLLATPTVADQWAKTLGVPIAAPLALALAIACFALPLLYSRYFLMLGSSDKPAGSRDRKDYDVMRENLATGGAAARLYSRWLTAFLDRVDRFFGDAGMADRTMFPHAFGLQSPAPLWTAAAFDRCLLLALLYPIAMIFIMWAVSGHVGPAEAVLRLQRDLPGWTRGISVMAIGVSAVAFWRSFRTSGWIHIMWAASAGAFVGAVAFVVVGAGTVIVASVGTFAGAGAVAGAFAVAVAAAVIVAGAGIFVITFAFALAVAFALALAAVVAFAFPYAVAGVFAFAGALPLALASAFAVVRLSDIAIRNRRQGMFLLLTFVAVASGCLVAAYSLASFPRWNSRVGPWLLFLVLLTLLNAPFDWASLGLTRALLRRGLELKGWWPFFLALADALFAAVIIALLALTMAIGVQTFDALAVRGGGEAALPLEPLFNGIHDHPEAPEYWWVYALLLSTMIPSLINLAIGGTALMRAVPGLSRTLLHFLPATGGVPIYDRAWIAAVLTAQAAFGAVLGVAVQAVVAWGLVFYAMPAVGLGLLDVARNLADLGLPTRLIEFVAGAGH
jgi:hypothetical protein